MAHKHINDNQNPKRSKSQKQRILERLMAGETLTPMDSILGGCGTKLATRVSELINEDGHTEIQKKMIDVRTADGGTTRVMSYFITEPKLNMAI